ncbi:hypothetical protein SBA3_470002 [Candidatus Sulfopaludibacter sp. SbA3]|nr:hypothetical protein SBA3_470002 [Candidatus Sulfopaludibacter sp. SbA3]
MNCAERDRLREIRRIADHETEWMYQERERIAAKEPLKLARFEEVIRRAEQHREEARANYQRHLAEHCCMVETASG